MVGKEIQVFGIPAALRSHDTEEAIPILFFDYLFLADLGDDDAGTDELKADRYQQGRKSRHLHLYGVIRLSLCGGCRDWAR